MTAGAWNIAVEQGATFEQVFLVKGGAGDVLDLTGCAAAMQVRNSLGDPTALMTLTSGNGGLLMGGPLGTITPIISSTALNPGSYVYDLKLTDAGGEVFRLLQGTIDFIGQVTTI